MYDIIDTRHRDDVVLPGMRLSGDYSFSLVKDCNWLQQYENIVDPRHLLREQIARVEDGLDPMSVTRDARPNKNVPTNAWNTIRLTTVASVFQASEA